MILGVYSMRDIKVGFTAPTVEMNDAVALRNFKTTMHNSEFHSFNAADFELYKLGEFDTDTGIIVPIDKVFIATGKDN